MDNIIITGVSGHIGFMLAKWYLENTDCTVIGIDNFIVDKHGFNKKKIKELSIYPRFFMIDSSVSKVVLDIKPDIIYHFASVSEPKLFKKMFMDIIDANIYGTINLLNIAKQNNSQFIFASSSEVYGLAKDKDLDINDFPRLYSSCHRHIYGISKLMAESIIRQYDTINRVIFRFFNVYGPGCNIYDTKVIPTFIRCALTNTVAEIYGNGTQQRTFTYIEDLISYIIRFRTKQSYVIENVSSGYTYSILEIAKRIRTYIPSFEYTIKHNNIQDETLYRRSKKIIPTIDFETSILKTIEYFRRQL